MPREHDERPHRPPAQRITPDGMDERSDTLGDTDRNKTDLRADGQRFELGRNPRGAPVSVNETITRYKEAQARKFSEHITKTQDAPTVDTQSASQRQAQDSGYPPSFTQPGEPFTRETATAAGIPTVTETVETPLSPSFSDSRMAYRERNRTTLPVPDSAESRSRSDSAPRLRFGEQPEGLTDSKAPGTVPIPSAANTERHPDQNIPAEQARPNKAGRLRFSDAETAPPTGDPITVTERPADPPDPKGQTADSLLLDEQSAAEETAPDEPASATDGKLSHERETFLEHDRTGRLQYDRAPIPPVKPPQRKPVTLDGLAYTPDGGNQADQDASGVPSGSGAETDTQPDIVADGPAAADIPTPEDGDTADGASETATDIAGADAGGDTDTGRSGKKKNSKLSFSDEADTPDRIKSGKKLDKARRKAGRSSDKLQTAREKLPAKRKLRMDREFDAEKGKLKSRLRFEQEVKTQREHLKGSAATRPVKAGAGAVIGYAHGKMYQVEQDNVGVKAAHRTEVLAEGGVRAAYRAHKTAPYHKVEKLERKTAKLSAKASYKEVLHENPELKKKHLSRMIQKRRIKREYAKAAREAKRTGTTVKKTAAAAKDVTAKVVSAIKNNPKVFAILALVLLVVVLMFGLISSCSNMASGIGSSVVAMSYISEDADIDGAELRYTELETDLRIAVQNAETTHSGYDEYRYNIGAVGHDPYMLMGFLTAVYQDFTLAGIQSVLDSVFNEQYQLTFTPSVEIRYRTETVTSSYTDPETGDSYDDSYEIEVPYEWHILTVTLTSRPLFEVISPRMSDEQSHQYALLMQSKGLRQYASSPFGFNWLPYVSSYYGYRVHPITGVKDYHLGIDIAPPAGTEIQAGHDGTVTFAGVLGGYGNVVVIEDGAGLVTKYAHCDTLFVSTGQTVTAGDVIATVGNTGDSTGPHLHFEVIKDGQYLNPIYFSYTNSY